MQFVLFFFTYFAIAMGFKHHHHSSFQQRSSHYYRTSKNVGRQVFQMMGLSWTSDRHRFRSNPLLTGRYMSPSALSMTHESITTKSVFTSDGFAACTVVHNKVEAEGLRLLTIEVPSAVYASYQIPGQYVKLRPKRSSDQDTEPKASFFAIASPPEALKPSPTSNNQFTFLVKDVPSNSYLKEGNELEISEALGKGFGVENAFDRYQSDFPVNHVVFVATGSGIAPIAAAIEASETFLQLQKTSPRSLVTRRATLVLGIRSPDQIPLLSWIEHWVKDYNIRVIPVFSQPPSSSSASSTSAASSVARLGEFALAETIRLPAYHGYVQDLLALVANPKIFATQLTSSPTPLKASTSSSSRVRFSYTTSSPSSPVCLSPDHFTILKDIFQVPRNTAVLLCGQRDMTTAVRDIALQVGVFEGRILQNF